MLKTQIKTKIICTMGPSVASYDQIVGLIGAGMDVARLNLSHGTYEDHEKTISQLKKARKELGVPLAIMLDTKGAEIRLGKIQNGKTFLEKNQEWILQADDTLGDQERVSITPGYVLKSIPEGARILFDNGYISSKVIKKGDQSIKVKLESSGEIHSGKGVNVPGISLNLPSITDKDIADIEFGCEQDVDWIAASFIRSPDHVLQIKAILKAAKKEEILVVAKIENQEGVEQFDAILSVADGIMVARGDLGVEVPLAQVPILQKKMIRKSYMAGKPVVTATQMLETMITSTRPTRAETSDVANAIYDSTSAVMLSGETAVGKYPVETVEVMHEIVKTAESDFDYKAFFDQHNKLFFRDIPAAITLATVNTAYIAQAKAIFVFTCSGLTARLVSRLRPEIPIIALTPHEKTFHQMNLNWGVIPVLAPYKSLSEAFEIASAQAISLRVAEEGDFVVITAGTPFGLIGTTNMMLVQKIRKILIRGFLGKGDTVQGTVYFVDSSEEESGQDGKQIYVLSRYDSSFESILKNGAGIVLDNQPEDLLSEEGVIKLGQRYNIPILTRAKGAMDLLQKGQLISLEPGLGLIFEGAVL